MDMASEKNGGERLLLMFYYYSSSIFFFVAELTGFLCQVKTHSSENLV